MALGMGAISHCHRPHVPVYLDSVLFVPELHHEAQRCVAGRVVHVGGVDYLHGHFYLLYHEHQSVRCVVWFDQCHYDFDVVAVFDRYRLDFGF